MKNFRRVTIVILCLFSLSQIVSLSVCYAVDSPKREMRGIWVATVANIDWPSQPGLSEASLRREACDILDRVKRIGLNTVFLQVRPSADAIYRSDIEPLSSYLVGEKTLPEGFDPLQFWIDEAHRRGLELHAWVNPFRVTPKENFPCADNHLSKTHPDWLISYASKLYLNPGLPEARDYVSRVVLDIARRYDIDGIHFDDYFYPYPVKGEVLNDSLAYRKHNADNLSLADWRRSNVDDFIQKVGRSVHELKPWLAFGVSPFGVWRNKRDDQNGSNTFAGITNYDVLYADVEKWIREGWIDYVVPQIYWESGNKAADFDELTEWWGTHSYAKAQVFVGHAIFKVNTGNKAWENPAEIPSQITKVRDDVRLGGSIFFSYRQFNRDLLGLEQTMQENLYSNVALSPLMKVDHTSDITVEHLHKRGDTLRWDVEGDTADVRFYAIYRYEKRGNFSFDSSQYLVAIVGERQYALPQHTHGQKRSKYIYRVAPIDKYRVEHELSGRVSHKE